MKRRMLISVVMAFAMVLCLGSVAWAVPGTGGDTQTQLTLSPQSVTLTTQSGGKTISNGTYLVQSGLSKWMVLDVASASTANGANVQIYRSNMTNAQKWKITYSKKAGAYTIQNVGSKKYLDVSNGTAKSGTNVWQYAKNGSKAQLWNIVKNTDGTYAITSALNGKLALDVAGAKASNGANVRIQTASKSKAQKWNFINTKVTVPAGDNLKLAGWYTITPSSSSDFAFDIKNGSITEGTNVQLSENNAAITQLFKFVYKDGYYRIINARAQKPLTAESGNLISGTNVVTHSGNGDAQLFAAKKNSDGTVTFTNKANGMAITMAGDAKDGTNIVTATSKGKASQRFTLTKSDNLLPTGICSISPVYTNRVIEVAGGSIADGAAVQLYDSNATFAQKWQVILTKSGTYRFRSLVSGKYLGLSGSSVTTRDDDADGSQEWTASISDGGFVLTNKKAGKVLDVTGAADKNGTKLQVYTKNGSKAQSFIISEVPIVTDGVYTISTELGTAKVLDVAAGSKQDGANVRIYAGNNSGAQKWIITHNSDDTYTIVNAQSGKALDIKDGKAKSGANVQQWYLNSTKAQRWKITFDGKFKITSALKSSLVLDVQDAAYKDGANVRVWTSNDTDAQRWTFTPTTFAPLTAEMQAMATRAAGYSSPTKWLVLVNTATNRVGVFQGSKGKWANVNYWTCSTGAARTPTVKGEFAVSDKFISYGETYTCWWATRFNGTYLFNSVLYEPGSKTAIEDGRLGQNITEGSVRLPIEQAEWIYNNIPNGTKVVVY